MLQPKKKESLVDVASLISDEGSELVDVTSLIEEEPVKKKDQPEGSASAEQSLPSSLPASEKDAEPSQTPSATNGVDETLGGELPEVEKTGSAELVENKDFVGAVPEGYYAGKSGQMIPVEDESEFDPANNKYGSAALNRVADFGARFYNAFIPGFVRAAGNATDFVGDLAEMGANPNGVVLSDNKPTDRLSKYLRSTAKEWEDYVSPKGSVSVMDDPTSIPAWAGAIAEGGASLAQIVLTGGGAGAVAVSGSLGVDAVKESAREAGLNDRDAAILTMAVAPAVAALDMVGLESITSNKTVLTGITKQVIEKTAGKLSRNAAIEAVAEIMPEVVKKAGKGFVGEGFTEAAQEVVQGGSEMIYDATQEEDKFKTTPEQIGKRALVSGAIGGLLGGAVSSVNPNTSEEADQNPDNKIAALEEQLRRAIAVQDKMPDKEFWQANIDRIKNKLDQARAGQTTPQKIEDIPEIQEANDYHKSILADPESADFQKEQAQAALENPVKYLQELRDFHQDMYERNGQAADKAEVARLSVAIDKAQSILNPPVITPEQAAETALETVADATPENLITDVNAAAGQVMESVKAAESFDVGETVELSATPASTPVISKSLDEMLAELEPSENIGEPVDAVTEEGIINVADNPAEPIPAEETVGTAEDAVLPEETTTEPATKPIAKPEQPKRQFVEKLQEQSNLSERFEPNLEELLPRESVSQDETQASAIEHIKAQGLDKAYDEVIGAGESSNIGSLDAATSQAVRGEIFDVYNQLIKQAEEAGDTELADSYYDKASNVLDAMLKNSTNTARALAYQNRLGKLFETKQGAQRMAKKAKEKASEQKRKKSVSQKRIAKKAVNDFKKEKKSSFVKSEPVQKAVSKIINKAKSKGTDVKPSSEKLKKLQDKRAALKAEYLKAKRGTLNSSVIGIDAADIAYFSKVAATYVEAGAIKIEDVIKKLRAYAQREHGIDLSDDDLNEIITDEVKATIERQPKAILNTNKAAIDELLITHFDSNGKIEDLKNKLVNDLGLDAASANELATELDKQFKEYASTRKEALINKRLPKKKKLAQQPKEVREFYQDVIDLSNLGAIGNAKYDALINDKIGSTDLTREEAGEINRMVDVINKTPEGQFKNREIQKLMDYIANMGGVSKSDYFFASYKAGLFSGYTTQAVNVSSNVIGTTGVITNIALTKPHELVPFLKGFVNALPGAFMSAGEVIKTGYDPRQVEESGLRVLERTRRGLYGATKAVKLDPTLESYKRYTFRMLKAMDMLTSVPTTVARQAVLEQRAGKELGLKGKDLKDYVRENMGYDQSTKDRARTKAVNEVESGQIALELPKNATDTQIEKAKNRAVDLRTEEIISQNRNEKLLKQSKEYAELLNYMNQPTGFMGDVAQSVNAVIRKYPFLSLMIPVVNIAANIAQRGMQLTPPIALARAIVKGGMGMANGHSINDQISEIREKLDVGDAEIELRMQRAVVGTVAMLLAMGLTAEDDKGESISGVKIHGGGPDTPEKKYQLQETGYVPFSIQVGDKYYGYKNSPLNFMLSMIGSYYDSARYGKISKAESLDRMRYAMGNMGEVIFQSTFLKSITDFFEAIANAKSDPKGLSKIFTNPISAILIPNFTKQVATIFDPKLYRKDDITAMITANTPLKTWANVPQLNALGEPIEKPAYEQIVPWSNKKQDAYIWNSAAENGYTFTVPSQQQVEARFNKLPTEFTPEMYNRFFKLRGRKIKEQLTKDNLEAIQAQVDAYEGDEAAKRKLYSNMVGNIVKQATSQTVAELQSEWGTAGE